MRKTISGLEWELKREYNRYKSMEAELFKVKAERDALREWISGKFNWWIELLATQKQPCLKYLIKNTAAMLGMKE